MLLLFALSIIANSYQVALYGKTSDYFPIIRQYFEGLSQEIEISQVQSLDDLKNFTSDNPDLFIISEENELIKFSIKGFCEDNKIPCLFLNSGESSGFSFFLEQNANVKAGFIIKAIEALEAEDFALIWPFNIENQEIYEELKGLVHSGFRHLAVEIGTSVEEISSLLIRIFKSDGIQNFVVIGHGEFCEDVFEGFIAAKLNAEGNMGLFLDECFYQINEEGSLFLVESDLESTKTKENYLSTKIHPYLSIFNFSDLSQHKIQQEFLKLSNLKSYSLINTHNSTNSIVGTISKQKAEINKTIFYYSNISDRSNFTHARISISANTGTFNPNSPPVFHNKRYHEGTYFAIEKINRDKNIFPNHQFYLYDKVDCGVSVFDFNYSKSCILKHIAKMGHAYIPTVTFINANLLDQLSGLSIKIPFIAGILSAAPLSNKSRFPTFIRIVSPASLFSRAWSNLINIYKWQKIVFHYANDSFGIASYETLNKTAASQGFKIINDEKYRMINNILSNESVPQYYEHMKNTISLGCNIIFLGMGDPSAFFWLEGMYDMGARRGDYTFIFFTTTGLDAFTQPTGNSTKRKELMHGSFVVYNAAWVGDYGREMREDFLRSRNVSWCRSYNIDAVYTAAKTTEFLLAQGKNYEDNDIFNSAMRLIRFTGTTGVISFDSTSNDRNIVYFNLFNFYEDDNGVWHDDEIALISPLGSVYFQSFKEGVWPTGGIPKDMKENYKNCNFREEAIRDSSLGKRIKIIVSIVLLVIVTILTVYSIKKQNYVRLELMSIKAFAMFDDYVILGFILVESIQIISIGPSFKEFNQLLSNLAEIFSLNYLQTAFWIIFLTFISLTANWLVFLLANFTKFYCGLKIVRKKLKALKPYTIPIMSNYLFIPVIVSLFSILMCDKSTGDSLTDSYLNYDCTLKCWRSTHLIYVVLSCIEIVTYVPIAILYRTLWQNDQVNVNIKVDPLYLVVKTMNVVILVVLSRILREDFPLAHSYLFLFLQLAMVFFLLGIKHPFNYDRANLWCKSLQVCVIWNTFVCILSLHIRAQGLALVTLQFCGWAVIAIVTIRFQSKLPYNLLISKKGPEIKDLFMFSFGQKKDFSNIVSPKLVLFDVEARSKDNSKSG